jgi:leucyl-tRNA synthetase
VNRVERLVEKYVDEKASLASDKNGADEKELAFVLHTAIKGVTEDAEKFQFNTSVARLMELINALYKYDALTERNGKVLEETIQNLLILVSPFAPHFAEEMWQKMEYAYSIFNQKWPSWNPAAMVKDTVEIAVQVNGQVKYRIEVPSDADKKAMEELALKDEKAAIFLKDREIMKVVAIPGRLVNIVIKK